jgi:hypothetical protein
MWRTRVIFPLIGPLGGVVVLACRFAGGFGGVRASYGNVLLKGSCASGKRLHCLQRSSPAAAASISVCWRSPAATSPASGTSDRRLFHPRRHLFGLASGVCGLSNFR